MNLLTRLIIISILLLCFSVCHGQETSSSVYIQGKKYLDINIRAKEKCARRISHQQAKLLQKLKRKEKRYAAKLQRKDSAGHARYQQQAYTYDSLERLQQNDSALVFKRESGKKNHSIDSLKRIKVFCEEKSPFNTDMGGYDTRLQGLKEEQAKQDVLNRLIQQRSASLERLNSQYKLTGTGLTGIQKAVFYSKEKMGVFSQVSGEPTKTEEKALEFLQGQEGFEGVLKGDSHSGSQSMGVQTRAIVESQLKERFGGDLSGLGSRMGGQVKQFDKQVEKIQKAKTTTLEARQTKRSFQKYQHLKKPAFKVNPMRGLPLDRRIEKQFNYQTTRPTPAGTPAMLHVAAVAGFRYTPSLTYGAGLAVATGLGQSWSDVRFSFEGIGLRTYAEWKWQYGFGAYAGYERLYKRAAFTAGQEAAPALPVNPHNTPNYNEAILIGLTKTYRLNDKWNGGIQVLYDVWWKDKLLKSPLQIRFTSSKQ